MHNLYNIPNAYTTLCCAVLCCNSAQFLRLVRNMHAWNSVTLQIYRANSECNPHISVLLEKQNRCARGKTNCQCEFQRIFHSLESKWKFAIMRMIWNSISPFTNHMEDIAMLICIELRRFAMGEMRQSNIFELTRYINSTNQLSILISTFYQF